MVVLRYVSVMIRGIVRKIKTQEDRFGSSMTSWMDVVKSPDIMNVRVDQIELKETANVVTKRVNSAPPPQPPMPLLAALIVYVDS